MNAIYLEPDGSPTEHSATLTVAISDRSFPCAVLGERHGVMGGFGAKRHCGQEPRAYSSCSPARACAVSEAQASAVRRPK